MVLEDKRLSEKIIWCLTVFLFSSFFIFDGNTLISVILFGITMAIFAISACQTHFKIWFPIKPFHIFVMLFLIYCIITSLWAIDSAAAIEKGITIFEILVCMSLIASHYYKFSSIKQLMNAVMCSGFIVSIYAIAFYGLGTIQAMVAAGQRLENSFANINSIAMVASVSLTIAVYKILFEDKKKVFLLIFLAPVILIVAASGSRKALALAILGIVLSFLFKFRSQNLIRTIFRWAVVGIILFIFLRAVLSLPMFSIVNERMEGLFALISGSGQVDHSAWLREQYIKVGVEQFKKTPIFGIGIANSNYLTMQVESHSTYLHNNFVELLACGGLIGFALYYSMFAYITYNLYRFRKLEEPYNALCLILVVILLIMDYGSVSYYSKNTYFYLMILFMEVEILKDNYFSVDVETESINQGSEEDIYV